MYLRDDGTPYYVGKGIGYRAFHLNHNVRVPKDKSCILIFERNSEQEALNTEQELISNWGRKDIGTGCLRNVTSGGEVGPVGAVRTAEQRLKISQAGLGNKKALGHIGKTGSSEQMRKCGFRGHHIRWHQVRNIVSRDCQFCMVQ